MGNWDHPFGSFDETWFCCHESSWPEEVLTKFKANTCWTVSFVCLFVCCCCCCFHMHKFHIFLKTRRVSSLTIHIRHTGLLHSHFPSIINHYEHFSCFMKLVNRMTAQVLAFKWPCDLDWTPRLFQTGMSQLCLASYKVWNKSVHRCPETGRCWTYISYNHVNRVPSLEYFWYKLNIEWASTKLTGCDSTWIKSKSAEKSLRKWTSKLLISHTTVALQWHSMSSKCRDWWSLSSYQIWMKSGSKCLNASQC